MQAVVEVEEAQRRDPEQAGAEVQAVMATRLYILGNFLKLYG